ncbi:carbon-nitrogen family hydrolase [Alkalibacterium putridalgicola]|uniref:carbon-nitrogen family hydrolase n=1 Tax=Alkalibacterium putridalgicola TaxID=426703 RepID=UPI0034CE602E
MRVAVVQPDLAFKEPAKNFRKISELIRTAVERKKPDVIVLPEMWNVSFFPKDLEGCADVKGEETKRLLSDLSKKYMINIVGGSVAVQSDGKFYNTSYVFNRKGEVVHVYNKVHLFSPTQEHQIFKAGNQMGIFDIDGVKAGIAICYDLRFPEWIRKMALEGIQVLFVPAAWPHPRMRAWETLLCARAIENQFFVVGVNSVGTTDKLNFCGHSSIFGPSGESLAAAREEEMVLWADLDLTSIPDIRREIAVYNDRRRELY